MKPKITARKYMGDDLGSWAVFVDGKPTVTGLYRSEVPFHKKRIAEILAERTQNSPRRPSEGAQPS